MSDEKWKFTKDDSDYELSGSAIGGMFDPKLGTHVHRNVFEASVPMITIDHANAKIQEWLEDAPVVMAHRGPSNPEGVWIAKPYQDADATHTGRLIMIEEIKPEDTAESLLRGFAKTCEGIKYKPNEYSRLELGELYDRARKFLEDK